MLSAIAVSVCRTSPTKIRISVRQLYPKLRSIHKKERFHDTEVQSSRMFTGHVVVNSSEHAARKRKTW